ncbi:hypothetical protein [Halomonas sp. I5-271120]|uniref:hypothetical protein n=1 Tax=Halomonas sp. I5-271120 TaxID=3061632 RepID=UPI002714892F|nr:hypothetical protein [Halomonas sp. I5-271120]
MDALLRFLKNIIRWVVILFVVLFNLGVVFAVGMYGLEMAYQAETPGPHIVSLMFGIGLFMFIWKHSPARRKGLNMDGFLKMVLFLLLLWTTTFVLWLCIHVGGIENEYAIYSIGAVTLASFSYLMFRNRKPNTGEMASNRSSY